MPGDESRHGVPTLDDLGGYSPVRVAPEGAVGEMSAGPLTVAPRDASRGEPAGPARALSSAGVCASPAGPAADVCGYDEHVVTFARKIAIGVVLCILGAAAAIVASEGVSGVFWLPWVVGSLGSGIALIVIEDDDAEPHCEGKR